MLIVTKKIIVPQFSDLKFANHIGWPVHTLDSTASSMAEYASTAVELECLGEAEGTAVEGEEEEGEGEGGGGEG